MPRPPDDGMWKLCETCSYDNKKVEKQSLLTPGRPVVYRPVYPPMCHTDLTTELVCYFYLVILQYTNMTKLGVLNSTWGHGLVLNLTGAI